MASLTIRHLDDVVVERVKTQAASNKRSLEAELREVLTNVARQSRASGCWVLMLSTAQRATLTSLHPTPKDWLCLRLRARRTQRPGQMLSNALRGLANLGRRLFQSRSNETQLLKPTFNVWRNSGFS